MKMKRWAVVMVAVAIVVVWVQSASAAIIFFDDTFTDADWSLTPFVNHAGSTSALQQAAGGNLGAFRRVSTTPGPAPAGLPAQILGFHQNLLATYDPGVLGEILSLDYSEDAIMLDGFGDGQASGPALLQNGQVYIRYAVFAKDANWTPKSFLDLTQNSFSLVNLTDTTIVDGTQHPDFSATGLPIDFGFFRFNATGATAQGGGTYTILAGIDNWRIEIERPDQGGGGGGSVIPEPTSMLLFGLGGLGLGVVNRRRRSRSA